MPYRAGTAFVPVVPSLRGFQTKIAAEAKTIRPIKVPVEYDTRRPIVPRVIPPVRVPVEADTGRFDREVRTKIHEAIAAIPRVVVDADTDPATRRIQLLRAQLETLADKRIGVDISAEEAMTKLGLIRAELDRLGSRSANVQVRADTGAAAAELAAVETLVDRIDGRRAKVKVDVDTSALGALGSLGSGSFGGWGAGLTAALPVAAPILGALGAGAAGGSALFGGLAAGGIGGGALILSQLKSALDIRKNLKTATTAEAAAVAGLRSAQYSLNSAVAAEANARIQAGRAIADAQRALGDARRNAHRSITDAEAQLADSETRVREAMTAVHKARVQARRDLVDLTAEVKRNATTVAALTLNAQDAQINLQRVQDNIFSTAEDISRATVQAAAAQQDLADAQTKQKRDQADLNKVQRDGIDSTDGVKTAQKALTAARKEEARAAVQLARAQADAARSIATAERNLGRARADAARSIAQAQAQVAQASAALADAQTKANAAQAAQLKLLNQLTPGQKRVLAGVDALRKAWHQTMLVLDKPITGATLGGLRLIRLALAGLVAFIRPVLGGITAMEKILGRFLAGGFAKKFAADFGVFTGSVMRDAGRGIRDFLHGSMDLLREFFPMAKSMSKSLAGLMHSFRNWAADPATHTGIKAFTAWARREGPVVLRFFGSLITALVNIGRAVAPFGELVLQGLVTGLQTISKMDPRLLAGIAAGIGAIILAAGGGGFGAVMAGVSLLGAGLTQAAKSSKTFRDALTSLGKVGKQVFGWLVDKGTELWKNTLKPGLLDIVKIFRRDFLPAWKAFWPILRPIVGFLANTFFSALKGAIGGILDVISGVLEALSGLMNFVTGVFTLNWSRAWTGIKQIFGGLWRGIWGLVKTWFNVGILKLFGAGWLAIRGLFRSGGTILRALWRGLMSGLRATGQTLWRGIVGLLRSGWDLLTGLFRSAGRILSTTWTGLWNGLRTTARTVFAAIRDRISTILDAIKTAFQTAVDGITTVWNGLKAAARAPVKFFVNTIYGKGIYPVVNAIPGLRGKLPDPNSFHFASGGVLPGYTPGRDVHMFYSRTGGSLALSGGESIMVPEWTRQMGGPRAIAAMNKAARAGRLRQSGDVGAFASGGAIDPKRLAAATTFAKAQAGKPYIWGSSGPAGFDCSGFMSAITNVLRGVAAPFQRVGATSNFPWAGFKPGVGEFTIGSTARYPGSSVGHMAGTLAGMNVESRGGTGVLTGKAARGYNDPGFNVIGHLGASGAKAASGGGGLLGAVKAVLGFAKSVPGWIGHLFNMDGWGPWMGSMAKSVTGDFLGWARKKAHIPSIHLPSLSSLDPRKLFDNGGWLLPGATTAVNKTGQPEAILTADQWRDIRSYLPIAPPAGTGTAPVAGSNSSSSTFNIFDVDGKFIGALKGIAAQQAAGHSSWSAAMAGAGMAG